ncbi:uncharacterized protein PHACADRAFT_126580 [Phanerochaete carnosa HHB-10118-sp]|uniref:Uncharacterized protein n=1 Tax=Phanerochaete carnosa (strain HHB-10118-sp) TaxID=650164 RepID=K5W0H4_PHACS|nr:uncharacterized protein PHACADRAFT_126580 [Phanerochaete carnosa HHB-10118-sp]EKM52610.1 hypothetical protein PHACADRAFT_126580 [Phanerochaete carnosa HHB-10118-sp]
MMFIFGFFLSCFNGIWAYGYLCWACGDGWRRSGSGNLLVTLFSLFIAAPVLAFSVIMPFFGGWIVVPIMQKYAWDHYCDSFPAFAILDARSYNDPSYTVNVAYFFMNQPSAGSPTQLFTYEIANTDGGDNWRFSLRSWDTAQSSIPLDFYPTLQAVHYNFYQLTIDGNCTLSANASAAGNTVDNTATVPCMTGTFDPSAHLHFNITSAVPLNSTLVSSYPAAVPNATSNLTIRDSNWDFGKYAPALALQELQPDGQLGHLILKTTVTAPHDSTELKVCVAGPEGRQGAAVQPEVFAPLGLVLMRQADYALYSTQPSSD